MTFRFNTDHLQTTVQFVEPPNQFLHLRLVRPVKVLQRKRKERTRKISRRDGGPFSFVEREVYLISLRFVDRHLRGSVSAIRTLSDGLQRHVT